MDPAAAFELYKRKVFAQPGLTAADDGLFAAMREQGRHRREISTSEAGAAAKPARNPANDPNLRLVFGVSRWLIDRIDAIPQAEQISRNQDPLMILTQLNAVMNEKLKDYKGSSIEEFRALLMPALEARIRVLMGSGS